MNLLQAIESAGLLDLAKTSIAYETLKRIIDTGRDLKNRWPDVEKEMKSAFDEDTAETARVLSNPRNWGISDPRWQAFCQEFGA